VAPAVALQGSVVTASKTEDSDEEQEAKAPQPQAESSLKRSSSITSLTSIASMK
jgi:serine protease inhibitor ecotin